MSISGVSAVRPERVVVLDRADGSLDPALLSGVAAVPTRIVGGVRRSRHAALLHIDDARIRSTGKTP